MDSSDRATTASMLAALKKDLALNVDEADSRSAPTTETTPASGTEHGGAGSEHDDGSGVEGQAEGDEHTAQDALDHPTHPPDFAPFYTLIIDPGTGERIHPNVHYIFSDDDPELLTNACLSNAADLDERQSLGIESKASGRAARERLVVLDMSATGKEVVSAVSLSPEWQALTTNVSAAPSWRGGDERGGTGKGLMLQIGGQERNSMLVSTTTKKPRPSAVSPVADIEDLLQTFDQKLSDLDGVLGAIPEAEVAMAIPPK